MGDVVRFSELSEALKEEYISAASNIEKACFSDAWTEKSLKSVLFEKDKSDAVFAVRGEKILGYGIFSHILGEGELLRIAVLPETRRKGLGELVMTELLKLWRELPLEKVFLEVRDGNTPAKTLYEKVGFEKIATRKKYYDGVEDAAIYKWEEIVL